VCQNRRQIIVELFIDVGCSKSLTHSRVALESKSLSRSINAASTRLGFAALLCFVRSREKSEEERDCDYCLALAATMPILLLI
jgi:hypothetical protein